MHVKCVLCKSHEIAGCSRSRNLGSANPRWLYARLVCASKLLPSPVIQKRGVCASFLRANDETWGLPEEKLQNQARVLFGNVRAGNVKGCGNDQCLRPGMLAFQRQPKKLLKLCMNASDMPRHTVVV